MSKETKAKIESKLTRIGISGLTEEEWRVVICALIYADADMDATLKGYTAHPKLKALPSLWLGQLAEGRDGAIVAASSIIESCLNAAGRTKFSNALSDLVQKEFMAATLGTEDENPVLRELLKFAGLFEGALKAEIAEKIVVSDLHMSFRVKAANLIATREFRTASSTEFWEGVRTIVQERPDFLHPLIRYYVRRHADQFVFKLLEEVRTAPSEPRALIFTLGQIYERRIGCGMNWEKDLRKHLSVIPDWLKSLLRQEVFCLLSLRPLLELLDEK